LTWRQSQEPELKLHIPAPAPAKSLGSLRLQLHNTVYIDAQFAETAIIDYRFSFADQEKQTFVSNSISCKQTEVFHFRISFCSKQTKVAVFR
jgi:hypothetical protein